MTKLLTLLFAALLGLSAQAHAFDSSDPFSISTPVEKPAKAPREKNDGHWLENQAKGYAVGMAAGAAANVTLGGAAAAMNPLVALPIIAVLGGKMMRNEYVQANVFYSGSVVRGRVNYLNKAPRRGLRAIGIDLDSAPSQTTLDEQFVLACLDVDGPKYTSICARVPKDMGLKEGDIVDIQHPVGVFSANIFNDDNLHFDFNKHMPRVVNVYCKAGNASCQNDYDSSLGVMSRPNITEFPPSQYLIDPAIIAADQAKMRKDEEEKKAASNSGGFNFM